MLLDIIYIVSGLLLLLGGGHFLVNAGVSAARKFKIAPFIIGATVVAFGTSAPELLVSVDAALSGHPAMVLGNVVGSNIANIALVLGATACILTLPVQSKKLFSDWLLVVASSILLIFFAYDNKITALEGIGFLAILALYLFAAIRSPKVEPNDDDEIKTYSKWGVIVFAFLASGAALAVGADLLVKGASNIARAYHISERIIAITIIAFGTSLPELSTSVVAALKKQTDISIGNIIGSNLFNILAVIGISSIINPIAIDYLHFRSDLLVMLFTVIILFLAIYPYRKNYEAYKQEGNIKVFLQLTSGKLTLKGGLILLASYFIYLYFLLSSSIYVEFLLHKCRICKKLV
jgi:cation:H+ antiporter